MRRRILVPVLLAGLAVAGCEQEPVGPTVDPSAEPATLSFLNGPENPGNSGVVRFEDVTLVFTSDPQRDLIATHYQSDDWTLCGGANGFETAEIQWVTNPRGVFEAIRQLFKIDDAPVLIYRTSEQPGWGDFAAQCAFLADGWLYRGTHRAVANDNDLFGTGPGANSFGWRAHGTVFDHDGNECRYTEIQKAVILPDGEERWIREDIEVDCP